MQHHFARSMQSLSGARSICKLSTLLALTPLIAGLPQGIGQLDDLTEATHHIANLHEQEETVENASSSWMLEAEDLFNIENREAEIKIGQAEATAFLLEETVKVREKYETVNSDVARLYQRQIKLEQEQKQQKAEEEDQKEGLSECKNMTRALGMRVETLWKMKAKPVEQRKAYLRKLEEVQKNLQEALKAAQENAQGADKYSDKANESFH